MRIDLEDIRCDTDEAGWVRGTVMDQEHNSLAVSCRDGKITFHTEGTPSFDITEALEIGALCVMLSTSALDAADGPEQDSESDGPADAGAEEARALIPGQRDAREAHRHRVVASQ